MPKLEARRKAVELRRSIEDHDYRYHVLDAPVISDREYDELKRQLIAKRASPADRSDPRTV